MWFIRSHAGKGTVGVALMALVVAVPPSINFLAGGLCLAWAIQHLRLAFEALEAEERREAQALAMRDETATPSRALATVDR